MAIIQLKSSHPQFSFLMKKNPNSGMQLRAIRKGMGYGWYSDDCTYNVYFKDASNEISYKQDEHEQFEYLNVSRYNTPLFPLSAINEFLSYPMKVQDERDVVGYTHSFFINMIHIDRVQYIEFFEKHVPECSFEIRHYAHKSYALTVTTQTSLYHLLHVVSVLCLFLSLFGKEYLDISDDVLSKYSKSINIIDAPFYIRNLFVRNFLSSKERYKKYKAALEKTDRYEIKFDFGGTALQRRNYIAGLLPFNKSIVDIGCGEGYYALSYASKIEDMYYAIDINEELLEIVQRKAISKQVDHIATFSSLDRFVEQYNGEQVDIILTEVIKHMSEVEAEQFIRHICTQLNFEQFIITTPNQDFNIYYAIEEFRHDDHRWEMGEEAFQYWMQSIAKDMNLEYEFLSIGDRVNSICTTQGVIFKRKEA
ncbi:SAM-dependent methyltransferase [Paenibacillus shirakamiensis]|uniref:Small RNA 2'-O-methyltransferase n=1 Tax=Paenibacillus shirakamiensis TaxID=1265935 RepID=A0ABS4JGH8_9BACL|nr:class I SAM-dependent methyltransferase [Paenibacillus shirakamiensis]MBP2000824.1 SAM-dependent methyltransferase [Paenibacillus shirakamiensis]